jgi:peptidoglycan/xylan/chitin deacetylase (PgdA/CDA1 family)
MRRTAELILSHAGDRLLRAVKGRKAPSGSLVILLFHSVGSSPRLRMDVSPETLVRTIEQALRSGFRIISLPRAVAALRQGGVADSSLVLTFDDGYQDFLDVVVPVLRRYHAPATVSIVPGCVESGRRLSFARVSEGDGLSWSALKRILDEHGDLVTLANHSYRHRSYRQMSIPEMEEDLDRSQGSIERNLGFAPAYFAYPHGARSEATDEVVTPRFDAVLTGAWGSNDGTEGKLLRRTAVLEIDSAATLDLKLRGRGTTFQHVQRLVLSLRGPGMAPA